MIGPSYTETELHQHERGEPTSYLDPQGEWVQFSSAEFREIKLTGPNSAEWIFSVNKSAIEARTLMAGRHLFILDPNGSGKCWKCGEPGFVHIRVRTE